MAFDFSTLITDRSPEDLQALRDLLATPMSDWTAEQLAQFNQAASKGAYNYTDLNRVIAAMDDINERLTAAGYVTGYQRIVVHKQEPEPVGPLPEGYTEREYIHSSGTQYINSGYAPNQDTRIIIDAKINNVVTENLPLCGARRSSTASAFSIWISADAVNSQYGSVPYDTNPISISYTQRLTYDFNRNVLTVGNQSATYQATMFSTGSNLLLCSISTNGSADSRRVSAKIYSCQVYDNDNLIRDFIPCVNSEGAVGLYDMVGAQFYGNAGSGTFTAGPEVPAPEPEPTLDPYTWYESDVPTSSLLSAYLVNVGNLKSTLTLPTGIPAVPDDMEGLTQTEANNIEKILEIINEYLVSLQKIFLRCGHAICGNNFYFAN